MKNIRDKSNIIFRINDMIGRPQLKTLEEEEQSAAMAEEDSPFAYQDDIDPAEMAGFSHRKF